MADLEQSLEELEAVKQSFKANINNTGISTSSVEFRNMPNLINQMEKKLTPQTKSVAPTTSAQSVTPDTGYKLTKVEVGAVNPSDYYKPEEVANVTPTTNAQSITPTAGAVFNQVNVSAVTSAIDQNIQEGNIREGVTILGKTGTFKGGITPTGTLQITENNKTYDVTNYANAEVNVPIDVEIQGYNVESVISEDGTTQTLKITTGTGEVTGGGDLIDVDELPTENVEDDKVYRVDKIVGEYVYGWPKEGPTPLGGLYTEIFVDDIDSVTNPQVSDMENYSLVVYTDTRTYTGYIFIDEAGTRASLAEMFGLDASKNHGLLYDDFSTITDAGVYYVVYANSTIGVPMISTNKEIMEYVKGEWRKYSRISNDMVVGLWFNPNTNEYLELKSTGEMNIKSSTGEIVYTGGYFASYNKAEAKNVVWLTYNSMEDVLDYVVAEDGVKLGDYVKQSELVVTTEGGGSSGGGGAGFDPVFANNTPEQLSKASALISYNNMTSAEVEANFGWKIGDTISYQLTTGENVEMRIIGFNHDDRSGGLGKAGITLEMVDCLNTKYTMGNPTNGWIGSTMRTTTLPAIKQTLPVEWQNIIKTVVKKTFYIPSWGEYNNYTTTDDELFLIAVRELSGTRASSSYVGQDNENEQYEYWTQFDITAEALPARIKKVNGTASLWHTRSGGYKPNGETEVQENGKLYGNSDGSKGVSFAFCI